MKNPISHYGFAPPSSLFTWRSTTISLTEEAFRMWPHLALARGPTRSDDGNAASKFCPHSQQRASHFCTQYHATRAALIWVSASASPPSRWRCSIGPFLISSLYHRHHLLRLIVGPNRTDGRTRTDGRRCMQHARLIPSYPIRPSVPSGGRLRSFGVRVVCKGLAKKWSQVW